jgi:N-acetylmuramoyl-L-alanine amidase
MGSCTVQNGCGQLTSLTHPSPNFGPRKGGMTPSIIVIHYTAMPDTAAACRTLCNPDNAVSAHYLIAPDGQILSLVAENMRAWHAGRGCWGACEDVNSASIGIELSNDGFSPFAAPLMDALCDLIAGIMVRWNIPAHRVIGHSDMAPGRKVDPGARFDWQRLARLGMAVWPVPVDSAPLDQFLPLMYRAGFTATDDDDVMLHCFRLHYRPHATGPLDLYDMALLTDLAQRFPVDADLPTT